MISWKSGVTIRMSVAGVSEQGPAPQGVKLIRLDETNEIAAITKLDKHEEDNNAAITDTAEEGTGPVIDQPDAAAADETGSEPENDTDPIGPDIASAE